MKVVVIGGTGHVGTYMIPRLVALGHDVTVISRAQREPYRPDGAWSAVRFVTLDRAAEEQAGTFGAQVAALEADVVIDMICFTLDSARHLVEALRGRVTHFLHCGSIWAHGPTVIAPTLESHPRRPFGEYGVQKAAIEAYLLGEAHRNGFPATVLHPGHIVGPGWNPLNPAGNFNPIVFTRLARGEKVLLPNFGLETVHHVHADDVAQIIIQAMIYRSASVGESFHAVSPAALSLRGYAESVAGWFGREPRLRFMPFEEWAKTASPEDAEQTFGHIARSHNCSIAKGRHLIGYNPRYSSLEGVREAVDWLVARGVIEVA